MKSDEAKKKIKHHEKRVEFYQKKLEKAEVIERRIGFKLNREQ